MLGSLVPYVLSKLALLVVVGLEPHTEFDSVRSRCDLLLEGIGHDTDFMPTQRSSFVLICEHPPHGRLARGLEDR